MQVCFKDGLGESPTGVPGKIVAADDAQFCSSVVDGHKKVK